MTHIDEGPHPWQSAHDNFRRVTYPRLQALGKEIGKAAAGGNKTALQIMELYELLYKSFDPLTAIRIEEALQKYETEKNLPNQTR